jgi:hypothetical protein
LIRLKEIQMDTLKLCSSLAIAGSIGLLSSCASIPDQSAQNRDSKGCKIVLVDSASKVIAGNNSDIHKRLYEMQTSTEQAEANAVVDKAIRSQPIGMGRTPGQMNSLVDARHDC